MTFIFSEFQPIAAIATTPNSYQRLALVCHSLDIPLWIPPALADRARNAKIYQGSLKDHIAFLWQNHRSFIFCLATGAVVRLIAPLLQDKSHDPAVIVIDENAKFVISLCSGHQGKADQFARLIALKLGATPILTGAANSLNLPGIDIFGLPFGWKRGLGDWTGVSAAIARGESVQVIQEVGSTLWQNHLPLSHPFTFGFPEYPSPDHQELISPQARIWISATQRQFALKSEFPKVQWHPRVLWIGIGCERGTSQIVIAQAIKQICQSNHLAEDAIAGIATIDIKADEVGLIELCRDRDYAFLTFPAEVLRHIPVPNPSPIVAAEVGTPSVAEAAALAAAKCAELLVSKQIFRLENQSGAVTIAIAQAEQEYIGHSGKLLLVGTGPGNLDQMTPAAQIAISSADVIIGYSLYIDLISPLIHPGQIIEALPITQERQRAERAIELAQWGLTVAVISSGDCGIYGMAGLVLEQLQQLDWDGKTPQVQVFPGISALQSAASRVGAPLMHDFCAISLSDLLTPWEIIEKRLIAAATADFVVAIYNPRSQTRIQQIAIAQTIFLQHRPAQTPVAIVHSAYREDEQITLSTLDKFLEIPIDMLTTVIIGNHSTCIYQNWMITPRGYLGFQPKEEIN